MAFVNLRELAELDLAFTLEGDFRLPVEVIFADGTRQTQSANDVESLLYGQVLYDSRKEDSDLGMEVISQKPVVTLRVTSLDQNPRNVRALSIPIRPAESAPKQTYMVQRPLEGGASIGFQRFYLMRAKQS